MANENVTQRTSELFKMDVQYLIQPGFTAENLMNDASVVMASAIGVLEEGSEKMTNAQWAAFYLFQQAKSMVDEAISVIGNQKFAKTAPESGK